VLGTPLQYLDGAADFLVAADHRVELARFGARREVDAVFLQRLALLLGILRLHLLAAAQLLDGSLDVGLVRSRFAQGRTQFALVVQRGQHEQLAGDELVATLLGQLVGEVEQPRQVIADVDVALLAADLRQAVEQAAYALLQGRHVDLRLGQQGRGRAALLVEQGGHDVHGFKDVVVTSDRQRLRVGKRLLETRSQFVHAHAGTSGVWMALTPYSQRHVDAGPRFNRALPRWRASKIVTPHQVR